MNVNRSTGDAPELKAEEILKRLFDVIIEEAAQRPDFAEKLVSVLPTSAIARIEKPAKTSRQKKAFNPDAFSLVALLQTQGEDGLKRQLNPIDRKQQLREIARAQHIPLTGTAASKRATLEQIRAALISGAKARLAGRQAAAS